jgi:lipopolysaccharide/colanic/teichoic acid biosynthesis glycosyltransferase
MIGILLTDGRPLFYRWNVVGKDKKQFRSWKLRTMVKNAEELKSGLLDKNEMVGPVFKIKNDPRILPFGRWLRRWSIDELPQFVNVLKGDMSLVGPRPAPNDELLGYQEWHMKRLTVKPGMTCYWQINGRNEISKFDDWVKLDIDYIEHRSLSLDLLILAQTIPAVISGKGAY